jgi:hypothetical protein
MSSGYRQSDSVTGNPVRDHAMTRTYSSKYSPDQLYFTTRFGGNSSLLGNGSSGSEGPSGSVGPLGFTGPVGETGFRGTNGTADIPGADGPEGPNGPDGERGVSGNAIDAGPTGADGGIGPIGPTRTVNYTGPTGPQGNPGTAVNTGPTGVIGPTGQSINPFFVIGGNRLGLIAPPTYEMQAITYSTYLNQAYVILDPSDLRRWKVVITGTYQFTISVNFSIDLALSPGTITLNYIKNGASAIIGTRQFNTSATTKDVLVVQFNTSLNADDVFFFSVDGSAPSNILFNNVIITANFIQ